MDRTPWESGADAGSKNWLMGVAMRETTDDNPYTNTVSLALDDGTVSGSSSNKEMEGDEDELPEDKFQLRMPKNVNK